MSENHNTHRGFPALAVIVAVAIVALLSVVPWGNLTNNFIKDFDLLADIHPSDAAAQATPGAEFTDPALQEAMQQLEADSLTVEPDIEDTSIEIIDGEFTPERVDGVLPIEDYTVDRRGMSRLKAALASGAARIAFMGDSYIEGDIFTQDVRAMLQEAYGGRGVGYMPAYSPIAGFRRTANVNGSNWTSHQLDKKGSKHFTIIGEYFTADGSNATTKYHGYKSSPRLAAWSRSSVLFIAPSAGTLTLITDSDTLKVDVEPGPQPQMVTLDGETSRLTVKSTVPSLVYLGAWLQDKNGVTVDCMSVRGDSGISHRNINIELCQQMRPFIDYDLIVLEYGINALTAEQTNYSAYSRLMTEVVAKIRQSYPSADILLMGVGDRGQKLGGEVHSLPTIPAMVKAQRECAQKAGVLFWDTREAMGGADAIVDWRSRQLVNGDYIHLNSAGGKALAKELVPAIRLLTDN